MVVKYAMIIGSANLKAFMSGEKVASTIDIGEKNVDLGEQNEEEIYRRMKEVIKDIYEENEKEEEHI